MDHYFLKYTTLFLALISAAFMPLLGQNDTTTRYLNEVEVVKKKLKVKRVGLYDDVYEEDDNIRGFTQLVIYENDLTNDYWKSKGEACISEELKEDGENKVIRLNWNKDLGGCDWVGFGFGWDGWTAKDIAYIVDTAAIELQVRSTGGNFTNIPWAFGLEDYSGQQAWLGYKKQFLKAKSVGSDWVKVEIPLSLFPFDENDVDISSVKQLLIQVFATGVIEIKSIRLVPFAGKLRKEVEANKRNTAIAIDGDLKDWPERFTDFGDGQAFAISYTADSLYFAIKVNDGTPRQNNRKKDALWNGDALEIAFSTNPTANQKRKFLLLSDQHLGLNCGAVPYCWNWKTNEIITTIKYQIVNSANGYQVELGLPFKSLYGIELVKGMKLGFEIAIDLGDGEMRNKQVRWNSEETEGFHLSPTKWGTMILN